MLNWWHRRFRLFDFLAVVGLTTAFGIWVSCFGGYGSVSGVLAGNRSAVYGTLASIEGSLLGFVIASVAIVIGYVDSGRLRFLEDSSTLDQLWRIFLDNIWWLAFATGASLLALVFDRDTHPAPSWLLLALFFITLMTIVNVARSVWALERVVAAVTKQRKRGRDPDIPGAGPSSLPGPQSQVGARSD